jgi:hypothetical protein
MACVAFAAGLGFDGDLDLIGGRGLRRVVLGGAAAAVSGLVFRLGDFDVEESGEQLGDALLAAACLEGLLEHPGGVLVFAGEDDLAGGLGEGDAGDDLGGEAEELGITPGGGWDLQDVGRPAFGKIPGVFAGFGVWDADVNAVFNDGGGTEPALMHDGVAGEQTDLVKGRVEPGFFPLVVVELLAVDALDPFDAVEGEDEGGDFLRIGQILERGLDLPSVAVAHKGERCVVRVEDLDAGDFFLLEAGGAALDLAQLLGGGEVALDAEDDGAESGDKQEQKKCGACAHASKPVQADRRLAQTMKPRPRTMPGKVIEVIQKISSCCLLVSWMR